MDTNPNTKLLFKDEVYQIVGAALEVLNGIGHGLHEKPYENALAIEFGICGIPFKQQPDLVAYDTVVVDAKVINRITDIERGQMLNYWKITKLRVAVLINFKNPKLEWERIVL